MLYTRLYINVHVYRYTRPFIRSCMQHVCECVSVCVRHVYECIRCMYMNVYLHINDVYIYIHMNVIYTIVFEFVRSRRALATCLQSPRVCERMTRLDKTTICSTHTQTHSLGGR